MSKEKFSIEDFNRIVTENFDSTVDIDWKGLPFHIKKHLSLEEMIRFVRDVTLSCFAEKTNEYLPEIKDFAIRCCILESYAGFPLPESITEKYEIVYSSDIVTTIVQNIDHMQFNSILEAIDRKVEHQAQSNIEALNRQVSEAITKFYDLEESLSEIFNGIDNKTVSKIAEAIASGSFDESKLVKAFTENMRSDSKNSEDTKG